MVLVYVFGTVLTVVLLWAASVPIRRRARRREATSIVEFNGSSNRLDVVTWSLAATVGSDRVIEVLQDNNPKTASDTAFLFEEMCASLSDRDRADMAARRDKMERGRAERALWDVQTESICSAASVGMLDSLIVAAGQHPDWAIDLIERSLDGFDASVFVISHVLSNKYDHYLGFFSDSLLESVNVGADEVAGPLIDTSLDFALDSTGHALAAIADAHLPVITIFRSVYRAAKSSEVGLEPGRVAENLALDVGLKGGGIAAGAAAGSFVFPVIGTVIGGILGGLIGAETAEGAKERHLRSAEARASRVTQRLGESVSREQWRQVATALGNHVAIVEDAHRALSQSAASGKRLRGAPLSRFVMDAAARAGADDVRMLNWEFEEWVAELDAWWEEDGPEFRGIFVLTRPDLQERFELDQGLADAANATHLAVGEERDKLALARG